MESLNSYICESAKKECRYFDAFQNKFVSGTDEDFKIYQDRFRQESPNHWGPAPKASDPENLLQGAVCTWGSVRSDLKLWVAFNKKHPDFHFDSCKAVAKVWTNDDYESMREFRKQYSSDYYIIGGCVHDVKIGNETVKVFDMSLS